MTTIYHGGASGYLSDAQAESTGAFVPLDNNDWDYSSGLDMNQSTPVTGGDGYLLPVILNSFPDAVAGDYYTLTSTAGIRVWDSNTKITQITSGKHLPADHGQTLWVEGTTEGIENGPGNWTPSYLGLNVFVAGNPAHVGEVVPIHVFRMDGPLDVPGNGTYDYTGDVVGGSWRTPTGGEVPTTSDSANAVSIKWNNTPEFGYANYQASPDYIWSCVVNVVGAWQWR